MTRVSDCSPCGMLAGWEVYPGWWYREGGTRGVLPGVLPSRALTLGPHRLKPLKPVSGGPSDPSQDVRQTRLRMSVRLDLRMSVRLDLRMSVRLVLEPVRLVLEPVRLVLEPVRLVLEAVTGVSRGRYRRFMRPLQAVAQQNPKSSHIGIP